MASTFFADASLASLGLLALRLVLGLLLAGHGAQKLFGWFGGHGLAGSAGFFEQLGFRPGRFFAAVAAGGEIFSGLLIAFGFLGPIGPAVLIATMIVAVVTVHWQHGLFATSNGIELPLIYGVFGAALALAGPGQYSLDALIGATALWTPALVWSAIAAGIIGGVANLAIRRPAPAAQRTTPRR